MFVRNEAENALKMEKYKKRSSEEIVRPLRSYENFIRMNEKKSKL